MKESKRIRTLALMLAAVMLVSSVGVYPALATAAVTDTNDGIQGFAGLDTATRSYVPDDYPTIQAAVDAASPGDTIIVRDGTHIENVKVNKDQLTITSENGAEKAIIQAANTNDDVFEVTADHVAIIGLTVEGATGQKMLSGGPKRCAGIWLAGSVSDNIQHFNISKNRALHNNCGIHISRSVNGTVTGNTVTDNIVGIGLGSSSDDMLTDNIVADNTFGIVLNVCSGITLSGNIMSDNDYNLEVFGGDIPDFVHNIDTSNTVNGKSVQYLIDNHYLNIDSSWEVGYLALVNSSHITVRDLLLTSNGQGVLIAGSTDVTLEDVHVSDNYEGFDVYRSSGITLVGNVAHNNRRGIRLEKCTDSIVTDNAVTSNLWQGVYIVDSSGNTLTNNTISLNEDGVYFTDSSNNTLAMNTVSSNAHGVTFYFRATDNVFYLNNFVDNDEDMRSEYIAYPSINSWHSSEQVTYTYRYTIHAGYIGNYWSSYTGNDIDDDGIGDTPHIVGTDGDADDYPLVQPLENYFIGTGLDDGPWPMFHCDAQRTGRSPYTGPDMPSPTWYFATGGSISSSPAIGTDGTVYVGSSDGSVYAINHDGTRKWSFTTGSQVISSPAIGADGTVYVGSGDGNVYAINPNGTRKWSFATENNVWSSPAIGKDGTVYIGSYETNLYAINPDGTEKWSFSTGGSIHSSPAIGADGTIYVGSAGEFYAINTDGTEKWRVSIPVGSYAYNSAAVGADGTVYVGSTDDNVYAINPDGTEKWSFATGGSVMSSPAIGKDGTIYVGVGAIHGGVGDGAVYAINPDGTQKWRFAVGPSVHSSPAIDAAGTVYVGSGNPYGDSWARDIYAINSDGTEKWRFVTGSYVMSSPAIGADGAVYVGSGDGKLYAIGSKGKSTPIGWLCFIATAAYGTPMAEEVQTLRGFRDAYLLTNPVGQALVGLYHSVSPQIAEFITEHPGLKPVVRVWLMPAVAVSTLAVNTTPAEKMAIVGLLALVSVGLAVWARRRRGRGPEVQSTPEGETAH